MILSIENQKRVGRLTDCGYRISEDRTIPPLEPELLKILGIEPGGAIHFMIAEDVTVKGIVPISKAQPTVSKVIEDTPLFNPQDVEQQSLFDEPARENHNHRSEHV